ncbi:MAG: hypothetical protein ABIH46_01230 [Chloroflexota bacterium]
MLRNPYVLTGTVLIFIGASFIPVFYLLLRSTPLTALGVSVVILGIVCLGLGRTRPETSPEVSAVLLQAGVENISALLEELGLASKAVYVPSSMTYGKPRALVPLISNSSMPHIRGKLPNRLIVTYGPDPEDIGLMITTPGSPTVAMLESKPGPSAKELESALSHVLIGMLDLANSMRVAMRDNKVTVEVSNPRMEYPNMLVYQCMGTPLASMIASIAAEALGKPVAVDSEQYQKSKSVIELEVLR